MILAAFSGRANTVKVLLDHGADFTVRDERGRTLLMLAERQGHRDIVALLKKAGAKE